MRSLSSVVLAAALASACTRDNPAFGQVGDLTESAEVGTAEGSETQASTAGDTLEASGSDGGSLTQSDSGSSGVLETGPSCELPFELPYGIASEPSLENLLMGCPEPVSTITVLGSSEGSNMQLFGQRCPECACADFPISLMFDVPLTQLDGCFDVTFQVVPDTCELLAYKIAPHGGGLALAIVSNVLTPAFDLPITIGLANDPTSGCTEGCTPESGYYALIANGVEIPPTGSPVVVKPYDVVNDQSGIDLECNGVGRWYARQG